MCPEILAMHPTLSREREKERENINEENVYRKTPGVRFRSCKSRLSGLKGNDIPNGNDRRCVSPSIPKFEKNLSKPQTLKLEINWIWLLN